MDQHLKFILSAGSSRTFNCCAISQAMAVAAKPPETSRPTRAVEPPPMLFQTRALNYSIFIKEPSKNVQGGFGPPPGKTLRTRIYIPYNRERPDEGGVSIDTRDPKLDAALQDQVGLDRKQRPDAYEHDKKIMRVLIELPSLDPFLMKDRFRQSDIEAPPEYLHIQPDEWEAIRLFVHSQFRTVANVIFAAEPQLMDERAEKLTEQLWDLKDVDHLSQLTRVFGIDPSRTEEIFYSWKGVIYYDYAFDRLKPQIDELFRWFDQGSTPKDFCKPVMEKELNRARTAIKNHFLAARAETEKHLSQYHRSFDLFFKEKKTASEFVQFLESAPRNFYSLGESLSKLSHGVVLWDRGTQNFRSRLLPTENLAELFGFIEDIF